ncbi:thiamine phosphate synthase [Schinkia azotoformans]|uniref:Thiamine monophosphate synthase n=1 Tax=Schinkia azotoformans LMG 9581 TaxID=1131731 RepID=K6CA03_SCHAZ|nr:thiamine phosphate synthase [Schinkia azotoformans]EKN67960.1 thiamine monophosphate synthase [Schinkia azotoformans LMG 9581]MEC1637020.1 thiamine phosphate synthase [Schinkia azotoformans]MEC1722160.1 thiamine phosphate synthase [Schinkia azotoformans]MEC1947014.1 thiamine phosphate synthase [Schinkia azotoformans]MED4351379.1 thiamine phosphate synthase [Schinkia azotoformans]
MLICVTNRKLCKDDLLTRIAQIAKGKPHGIMLREKDLTQIEYEALAFVVNKICKKNGVPLIINQNIKAALKLKIPNIHFSMENLRSFQNELVVFSRVGASVHSIEEAKEAERLGATYLVAGHIFATDCKKGVPPRGLQFLKEVCGSVAIPVFSIGGITKNNVTEVAKTGASGVCIMSEAMTCANPVELASQFRF